MGLAGDCKERLGEKLELVTSASAAASCDADLGTRTRSPEGVPSFTSSKHSESVSDGSFEPGVCK